MNKFVVRLIVVTFVILITTRRLDITLAVLIVLLCIISVVLGFMVSNGKKFINSCNFIFFNHIRFRLVLLLVPLKVF